MRFTVSDHYMTSRNRTGAGSAEDSEDRSTNKICFVCGDMAYSFNFNVSTCESCKAFFRRNAKKMDDLRCRFNESCLVTVVSRRFCQRCRLLKCFQVGMKKEWILSEEARLEKKSRVEGNRERRIEEVKRMSAKNGWSMSSCSSSDAAAASVEPTAMHQQLHRQQNLFQPELPLIATAQHLHARAAQPPCQQPISVVASPPLHSTNSHLVTRPIAIGQQMQQQQEHPNVSSLHNLQQQMAAAAGIGQQIAAAMAARTPSATSTVASMAPLGAPFCQMDAHDTAASAVQQRQLPGAAAAATAPPPPTLLLLLPQAAAHPQPPSAEQRPCCCRCACGKYTVGSTIVQQAHAEWGAEERRETPRRKDSNWSDMSLSELFSEATSAGWFTSATSEKMLIDGALVKQESSVDNIPQKSGRLEDIWNLDHYLQLEQY